MGCLNRPHYPSEGLSSSKKYCKFLYLKSKGLKLAATC